MGANPSVEVTYNGTKHSVFATGPNARLVRVTANGSGTTPAEIVIKHASTPVGTEFTTSDGAAWRKDDGSYVCTTPGRGETITIPTV